MHACALWNRLLFYKNDQQGVSLSESNMASSVSASPSAVTTNGTFAERKEAADIHVTFHRIKVRGWIDAGVMSWMLLLTLPGNTGKLLLWSLWRVSAVHVTQTWLSPCQHSTKQLYVPTGNINKWSQTTSFFISVVNIFWCRCCRKAVVM